VWLAWVVEAVRVDRGNAFRQQRRNALTFRAHVAPDGLCTIDAEPVRLLDVVAVLGPGSHDTMAALNAKHNDFLDEGEDYRPLLLGEIAGRLGLAASAYDVAWSTPDADFGNDLLVLHPADLLRLLERWVPRRLDLLDLPAGPFDPDDVALQENGLRDGEQVLPGMPGSTCYALSLDDHVTYVETRDPGLAARLLARMTAVLAGTMRLPPDEFTDAVVTVPPPDVAAAAERLGRHPQWTITATGGTLVHTPAAEPGRAGA
jgi:hypothetical protein